MSTAWISTTLEMNSRWQLSLVRATTSLYSNYTLFLVRTNCFCLCWHGSIDKIQLHEHPRYIHLSQLLLLLCEGKYKQENYKNTITLFLYFLLVSTNSFRICKCCRNFSNIFPFPLSTSSRPDLGSTQPPIQWYPGGGGVPGVKRPGREADYSPPTNAQVNNTWIYASTPICFHAVLLN
jgi:hypothetical protein